MEMSQESSKSLQQQSLTGTANSTVKVEDNVPKDGDRENTADSDDSNSRRNAGKASYKLILKKKQYRRRRMYKLAFKTLLARIEDTDTDTGSDDLVDSSEDEAENDSFTPPSQTKEGAQTKDVALERGDAEKEEEKTLNINYKAELYTYSRSTSGEQKPVFQRAVERNEPIQTEQATEVSMKSSYIFDVITMFAVPKTKQKHSASTRILAELGSYITIRSEAILDLIRDLVKYYPRIQPLRGDTLTLMEPFCILLHYRGELAERNDHFRRTMSTPESQGSTDVSESHEHLTHLLEFLSMRYDEPLLRELARHKEGRAMCTFEWVWILFKPGTVVYTWEDNVLRAFVVDEHSRDYKVDQDEKIKPRTFSAYQDFDSRKRPTTLTVWAWWLDFDGARLGRCRKTFYIEPFEGERSITSLPVFPKDYLKHDQRVHKTLSTQESLIQRGEKFFSLRNKGYRQYSGETITLPKRVVRGRVMIDTKYYYDSFTDSMFRPKFGVFNPLEMNTGDQPYADYDAIDPAKTSSLSSEQYLICSYVLPAFVLKTRQWEHINIEHLREPEFQVNLIKDLVLEDEAKAMIQALSHRYTVEKSTEEAWSADFVANKGEGQIFLLHGKPGVGKTTTAECVAELTKRPLLSLTCGDLGIQPLDVETALMKWLKLATSWEAILLLDEADVYLEARINQDLQRNSLVSIFLRALEYYQGIFFLTTNRVGTFDEGFVSRIHVIIHYPEFNDAQRGQIWDIFFKKLERERENIRVTQRAVDYAKDSADMKGLSWNGREIRNAFNTAVALAEYQNERDKHNRIVLHPHHLEQVVKMSRAFQKYIKSTLGMDHSQQARDYKIRNDKEGVVV
ncbi:hypothetical protein MMC30_005094 [Trapelia coarctata]|nr:hypothetical protein [Trapelia coarctata]